MEGKHLLPYICIGKGIVKGNGVVPFFFCENRGYIIVMTPDIKNSIEDIVKAVIDANEDLFLIDIKLIPGNHIKVFADAENGITIDRCSKINRSVYKQIEEKDIFPAGDFSLEVSSPGVDEPLKLRRQYKKNIGRIVEVSMNDGNIKTGKLTAVNAEEFTIEEKEGQGKKAMLKTINILFDQVKQTKVLVTF